MRWLTVNVPGQPDRQIILSALQASAVSPTCSSRRAACWARA